MDDLGAAEEEEEVSVLGFVEFEGEMDSMIIRLGSSVEDITGVVARKHGIDVKSIVLQYEHPAEKFPVTLFSNEDVRNMLKVHRLVGKTMCRMRGKREQLGKEQRREAESAPRDVDEAASSRGPIGVAIWGGAITGEGQLFDDANEFRRVLKSYCIAQKRAFKYERNDGTKITAVCCVFGCPWRVYAAFHKVDRSFGIRRCNLNHTCGLDTLKDRDNPIADANWVSGNMKDKLRSDLMYTPKHAMRDI